MLLINLGTPDAPEAAAVRRYLAEFLSDPRVIEIPRIAWLPILHGIILRTRPKKSAHAYKQVWTEEGSPLAAITRRQAEDLQRRLGEDAIVDFAMRYGNPGIGKSIDNLVALGLRAHPRRAALSAILRRHDGERVGCGFRQALQSMRHQPALRTLPPYYDDPLHIDALKCEHRAPAGSAGFRAAAAAAQLSRNAAADARAGRPLSLSLPEDRLVCYAEQLSIPTDIAFQSRFGRAKWLEPATDKVLAAYPAQGVKRIAIAAPGFSADCVETVEELGIRGRETFMASGGESFRAARLPQRFARRHDHAGGARSRRELAGWLPQP